MKKRVEQLLAGKFDHELPALLFSQEKLYAVMKPGNTMRGEVYAGTEDNRRVRGFVTSSDRRFVPGLDRFSGTMVRLPFGIDAKGLEPGSVLSGFLTFTTNLGEYRLPFEIQIELEELQTSAKNVEALSQFTRLARENSRDAFRLFTGPGFARILKNESTHVKALYDGFMTQPVTYQNMEEFLISAGCKDKVLISAEDTGRELRGLRESVQEAFKITRSGWGHLRLEVTAEGGFLEVEKHVITEDDFIGSSCLVEYVVHRDRLGAGNQYGRIEIRSPYQTIVCRVMASRENPVPGVSRKEKSYRLSLLKDYVDYRSGRSDLSTWAGSSHFELNQLKEMGLDSPEYRLYEAFVLLQEAKPVQAQEILKKFSDRKFAKTDVELAGAFLYLCAEAGLTRDKDAVLKKLHNLYAQKSESFILFFTVLHTDPSYRRSASAALFAMEELFTRGCMNPVLYQEAWDRISGDASLLRRINPFWMQVFMYAGRRGILTEELSMRFAYLSGYEKIFEQGMYRALSYVCRAFPDEDSLNAICRYIMLDDPKKKCYFTWYQQAVEKDVRLTRLYEYYVETMDTNAQKSLPRQLLLYFKYNSSSLSDTKMAYVYAGVINEKQRDPETYRNYRPSMESFARKKMEEGRMSEDFAVLYREFMKIPQNEEQARTTGNLLFTNQLFCDDRKIRVVVVRHHQLAKEETWQLNQGTAYPRLYTEDASILFQDEKQRRYSSTVNCSVKKLIDERDFLWETLWAGSDDPGLLLNFCEHNEIDRENLPLFQKAACHQGFTAEYRQVLRGRILQYYRCNVQGDDLDGFLKKMNYQDYASVDRTMLLQILIRRGMYPEALDIIKEMGCEGLERNDLLRLVSRCLIRNDMEEDEELLALASIVYRSGVYDDTVLKYLMQYRYGPMDELLSILKSAAGFELDTFSFEERILGLLMLTQDYRKEGEKVLESYIAHTGKERVVGAYLTQTAFGIFVKEYSMSPFIRKCLEEAYGEVKEDAGSSYAPDAPHPGGKWPVDRICRLALFKELSKDKGSKGRVGLMKEQLLKEAMHDKLIFSFYRRLPQEMLSPWQLDDKTFLECHASPEARVILHYVRDNGLHTLALSEKGDPEAQEETKPLQPVYEGIFVRAFTLFYGESLRYYFEIEEKGRTRRTAERVVTMNRQDLKPVSKYQQINQILSARRLGKSQEVASRLKAFLRQEQYVKEMFPVKTE